VQPRHGNNALHYDAVQISGRAHQREFEATVYLNDTPLGRGRGTSKKAAEELAAKQALDTLEKTGE